MGQLCSSCISIDQQQGNVSFNHHSFLSATFSSLNTSASSCDDRKCKASSHPQLAPLISDLVDFFNKQSDLTAQVSRDYLIDLWMKSVENSRNLSPGDAELIKNTVDHFAENLDLDNDGMISYAEFMTYVLGGLCTRGRFGNLREKLAIALEKDPELLQKIFQKFQQVDKDGDGIIQKEEIAALCADMAGELDSSLGDPEEVASQYMKEMDLDGDGQVDYYEFLSYQLGRRKRPVELCLYDLSNGMSQKFSWMLMGRQFEAIYHTGVVCFGMEYWYGGSLFQNEPPMDKFFGPPISVSKIGLEDSEYPVLKEKGVKVIRLGYTLYTKNEALRFLNRLMTKKYRSDNYDVLKNNCNHFTDEFIYFLTGNHIPDDIRNLPEMAMQTTTAKLLRPLLNMYLGGFSGQDNIANGSNVTDGGDSKEIEMEHLFMADGLEDLATLEIIPIDILPGNVPNNEKSDNSIHNVVLAKVVKIYPEKKNSSMVGAMDVRWFEPSTGKITTVQRVPIQVITDAVLKCAEHPVHKPPGERLSHQNPLKKPIVESAYDVLSKSNFAPSGPGGSQEKSDANVSAPRRPQNGSPKEPFKVTYSFSDLKDGPLPDMSLQDSQESIF